MAEEKNIRWTVATYESVQTALRSMGENYGKLSLHLNTAALMFLLSPEEDRERWVGLFERAKRIEDERTVVERMRSLLGVEKPKETPDTPPSWEAVPKVPPKPPAPPTGDQLAAKRREKRRGNAL